MESGFQIKCLGCLGQDPDMRFLFSPLDGNLSLAKLLWETTSKEVCEDDETPAFLCSKCARIVFDFYNFKLMFLRNHKYFQNVLQKDLKKNILSNPNSKSESAVDAVCSEIFTDENSTSRYILLANKADRSIDLEVTQFEEKQSDQDISLQKVEISNQHELVESVESITFCCEICNIDIHSEENFLKHLNCKHKIEATVVNIEELNRSVPSENTEMKNDQTECKICKEFVPKVEQDYHRNTHKRYVCFCGAKYLTTALLEVHKKSKHSEERNFVCQFCNKAFKVKGLLTKHLRLHTHPREEVCDICGQRFNDRSVLNTHVYLKHNPKREFQCYLCGLRFPLKSTLEKHIRRHTSSREKEFSCHICNMKYLEKSSLNRHISTKHSDQPIKATCDYCSKAFITKGNLYKHVRTVHKNEVAEVPHAVINKTAEPFGEILVDTIEETPIPTAEQLYVLTIT